MVPRLFQERAGQIRAGVASQQSGPFAAHARLLLTPGIVLAQHCTDRELRSPSRPRRDRPSFLLRWPPSTR